MNLVAHLQEQSFGFSGLTTITGAPDSNALSSTTSLHSNFISNWVEFPDPIVSDSDLRRHNEASNPAFEPSNLGQYTFADSVTGVENSCLLSGSRPERYCASNYAGHEGSMHPATTVDPSLLFPPSTNKFQVGSSSDILNNVAETSVPIWDTNPLWFSKAISPEWEEDDILPLGRDKERGIALEGLHKRKAENVLH
ncbi:uncharacterized protein FOMMEDRAFT_159046 [Fomitiporia mediterranea MF3/22]|uniref:uncharacterized protein n=1 Tax=Fomitiporia mediterranea (strain MF3/22) TaxID=694068 RepID=UPI000440932F|nr:uncharacterized protein FOMMEDRAFT_159046 [Fomitiporia mediterranea MF3/22]EJD00371.1 hypothetical protein FOMMEDRAFT_159046 [Fomitiporia mediterranea MF3/22]